MTNQQKSYIYASLSVLFWSTVATAFKLSLKIYSPLQLILLSSLTSIFVFLALITFSGKLKLIFQQSPKNLLNSAILGFLSPTAYYLVLFKAYSLLPAQVAQPLNYVWTIVLVLLSIPLLHKPISFIKFIGVIIGFAGAFIISTQGHLTSFKIQDPLGVSLALGSSVLWALYWIFNVRDKRDDLIKLLTNFVFGFLYLALITTFAHQWNFKTDWHLLGPVYIGFFEMGLTFFFWLKAMQLTSTPDKITNLIFFSPFLSLVFIHYILHEPIYYTTLIGLILIIIAMAISLHNQN